MAEIEDDEPIGVIVGALIDELPDPYVPSAQFPCSRCNELMWVSEEMMLTISEAEITGKIVGHVYACMNCSLLLEDGKVQTREVVIPEGADEQVAKFVKRLYNKDMN